MAARPSCRPLTHAGGSIGGCPLPKSPGTVSEGPSTLRVLTTVQAASGLLGTLRRPGWLSSSAPLLQDLLASSASPQVG